jgi:hypothetical protein
MTQRHAHTPSAFCTNCGYPRTGLPPDGRCPECGRSARAARRRLCRALVPLAGDASDGLLFGMATAGLGLLHLGRAWRYAGRDQTLHRLSRLVLARQRWRRLAQPRSLLLGWLVGLLLAVALLIGQGVGGELLAADGPPTQPTVTPAQGEGAAVQTVVVTANRLPAAGVRSTMQPLLAGLALLFLALPVLQSIAALGTWHCVALAAARLPTSGAQSTALVVGASTAALLGAIICYAVWPGAMSRFDDRLLLLALIPLVVAGGRWVLQWHQVKGALERETRPRAVAA